MMELVILDLEWNSGFSKRKQGYINEIIEMGAVRLNEQLEVTGQFSIFIRPEITRRLNPRVRELTQISNEDLVHGAAFPYALSKLGKFCGNAVVLTWSTSDLNALQANCAYYSSSDRIPFLRYYADAQAYCQRRMGVSTKNQMALGHAAERLNINTDDIPLHRAVGDSLLTARILRKLFDREAFEACIKTVDEEFYARLNFHSVYLYQLDDPRIDQSQMYFDCPDCGIRCTRQEEWKVKNKAFYAPFICPVCGTGFRGRIQFKLHYEGVTFTKRRVTPQSGA